MMRIGELRNEVRLSGEGKGDPVPRADHQELHHLAGDVGQTYGLTRSQVGQLGLRYYEKSVSSATPDSAIELLEKYKGKGGKFGVTEGDRPPVGFDKESRLRGFRKATRSESIVFGLDTVTGEVKTRPAGKTLRTSHTSQELGFSGAVPTDDPMRILASDATAGDAYHEAIHEGLIHAGLHKEFPSLVGEHMDTAIQIAQGLTKAFPVYKGGSMAELVNEAFARAAGAVRMGDDPALEELGRFDTSVDHVKSFVNTTAKNAYERSLASDSAPVRAFQRRMTDLVRRTDTMRTAALQRAQTAGYTTWFNPEIDQWIMRDGEGREFLKPNWNEVWDHVDKADPSSHFPDIAHKAYFKGLRGPMVPIGSEPVDGPSTLEVEHVPLGWQAVRSIGQPTLSIGRRPSKPS